MRVSHREPRMRHLQVHSYNNRASCVHLRTNRQSHRGNIVALIVQKYGGSSVA
ncbi:aspartate kinase, partial [Bifidobacterium animalis subsp. lactis]